MNSLAVRQVLPKGVGRTELVWTCFGYASDDAKMDELRMKQSNLVGPAGYISLEDGAATGFVQRGVQGASAQASVVEMGGRTVESNESRVTETSVRGLWQQYRRHMGF
jgi:anthranilate 1,2-dioxygenase large subunit/terephthalate 1,2-dioxygenase oxygenase component alpha subunit